MEIVIGVLTILMMIVNIATYILRTVKSIN